MYAGTPWPPRAYISLAIASSARRGASGERLMKMATTFFPASRIGLASGERQVDWKVVVAQATEARTTTATAARIAAR